MKRVPLSNPKRTQSHFPIHYGFWMNSEATICIFRFYYEIKMQYNCGLFVEEREHAFPTY